MFYFIFYLFFNVDILSKQTVILVKCDVYTYLVICRLAMCGHIIIKWGKHARYLLCRLYLPAVANQNHSLKTTARYTYQYIAIIIMNVGNRVIMWEFGVNYFTTLAGREDDIAWPSQLSHNMDWYKMYKTGAVNLSERIGGRTCRIVHYFNLHQTKVKFIFKHLIKL